MKAQEAKEITGATQTNSEILDPLDNEKEIEKVKSWEELQKESIQEEEENIQKIQNIV